MSFNKEQYINETQNLLRRMEQMPSTKKVKALAIYLACEKKYEPFWKTDIIHDDKLVYLFMDVWNATEAIVDTLTEKELEQYAAMLPD
jgi:hypothetical protein